MARFRAIVGGLGPTVPTLGRFFVGLAILLTLMLSRSIAFASERPRTPSVLQGRIDAAADMLKGDPRLHDLSEAQRRKTIQFVMGNLLFVLLHEMGHVLIHEMGLPVLGREEDAADSFATITILQMNNEFSDRVLSEAAKGWFYADRRDQAENTPVIFYDAHSLNRQRAYEVVCYMVGLDAERYAAVADETGLPEDRQSTCAGDFSNAEWSWEKVLKEHKRTTQPKTTISVRYADPENPQVFPQIMKQIQLLEVVAQRFSEMYVWRAPFTIKADTCGHPNADWNLATRTLTICHEIAEDFGRLYAAYATQSAQTDYRAAPNP